MNLNHPLIAYSWGNLFSVAVTYYFGSVGDFITSPSKGDLVISSAKILLGSGPCYFKSFNKSSSFAI